MKNLIPLFVALIFGTIAAFLIWNGSQRGDSQQMKTFKIAVANDNISKGTIIQEKKHVNYVNINIPGSTAKFIKTDEFITDANELWNQRTKIDLAKGAPIKRSDLTEERTVEEKITSGHWAVPLSFDDERLVQFIRPNMEIAILGSFSVTKQLASMEVGGETKQIKQEGTMVVLPKVTVMSIGYGEENNMGETASGAVLILDLTPDMAAVLVAAQREMELYPAIRKQGDSSNDDRSKVGMVTPGTFSDMTKGLKPIAIPNKLP